MSNQSKITDEDVRKAVSNSFANIKIAVAAIVLLVALLLTAISPEILHVAIGVFVGLSIHRLLFGR